MKYLGTTSAAEKLEVTTGRIRQLILAGRLKAEKAGKEWLILPHDLEAIKIRKPGRPRLKGGRHVER